MQTIYLRPANTLMQGGGEHTVGWFSRQTRQRNTPAGADDGGGTAPGSGSSDASIESAAALGGDQGAAAARHPRARACARDATVIPLPFTSVYLHTGLALSCRISTISIHSRTVIKPRSAARNAIKLNERIAFEVMRSSCKRTTMGCHQFSRRRAG